MFIRIIIKALWMLRRERIQVDPLVADHWNTFLESSPWEQIQSEFDKANQSNNDNAGIDFSLWQTALRDVSRLWYQAIHEFTEDEANEEFSDGDDDDVLEPLIEELWETLCFLLKAIFYARNGISIRRLESEESTQFLLHAAVQVLPLISDDPKPADDDVDMIDKEIYWNLLELILSEHGGDQLTQPGPVLDRLPIHLAATNLGQLSAPTIISRGYQKSKSTPTARTFSGEVLKWIAQVIPVQVATSRDATNQCALQLACQHGHVWDLGLEELINANPDIVWNIHELPPFVLLAAGLEPTKRPWFAQRWGYYNTKAGKVEATDTLYQMIRNNPGATALAFLSSCQQD